MRLLPRLGWWLTASLLAAFASTNVGELSARDKFWRSNLPQHPPAWAKMHAAELQTADGPLALGVLNGFTATTAESAPFAGAAAQPLLDWQLDDEGRFHRLEWDRAAPTPAGEGPLGRGAARLRVCFDRDGDGGLEASQVLVANLPLDCRFLVDDGWLFVASAAQVRRAKLVPTAAGPILGPWETLLVRQDDSPRPFPPLLGRTPSEELSVVFRGAANHWKGRDGAEVRRFDSAVAAVCRIDGTRLAETSWGYCRPIAAPWFDEDGDAWLLERRTVREAPGQRLFLQRPKLNGGYDAGWRWRAHLEAPTGDTRRNNDEEPFPPISPPPVIVGELGLATSALLYEGAALPGILRGALLVNDLPRRNVSLWLKAPPRTAAMFFGSPELDLDWDGQAILIDEDFGEMPVPFVQLPFEEVASLVESRTPGWAPVRMATGPDQRIYVAFARTTAAVPGMELGEFPATAVVRLDWTGLAGIGPATPPAGEPTLGAALRKRLEKAGPAALWNLTDSRSRVVRREALRELARRPDVAPASFEHWLESPLVSPRRLTALAEMCALRGRFDGWPTVVKLMDERHATVVRSGALKAALRLLGTAPADALPPAAAAAVFEQQRGVFGESELSLDRLRLLAALVERIAPAEKREEAKKDLHEITVEAIFAMIGWEDFGRPSPSLQGLVRSAGDALPELIKRSREQAAAGQDEDWSPYQALLSTLPPEQALAEFQRLLPTLEANRGNEGVLAELLTIHARVQLDFGAASPAADAWLKRSASILRPNNVPTDQSLLVAPRGDEATLKTIWKYVERQRGLRRTYAYAAIGNARRVELAPQLARELESKRALAVPGGVARMLLALSALRPLLPPAARAEAAASVRGRWAGGADDQAEWTLVLSSLYDPSPAEAEASALREWEAALKTAAKPDAPATGEAASASGAARPSPARLAAAVRLLSATRRGALRLAEDLSSSNAANVPAASAAAGRSLPREAGPLVLQALALHAEEQPDDALAELQRRVERKLHSAIGAAPRPAVKETFAACAACHSWNRDREPLSWGPLLPPPLLPAVQEWNQHVAAPSAAVAPESRAWRLALRDGRRFLGWPVYDSEQEVVFVQADGLHLHFPPAEVASCLPSAVSAMPPLLSPPLADDAERFYELLQRTLDQAGGGPSEEDDDE